MEKKKILFGLEATGGGALKHLNYLVSGLNQDNFDITIIMSKKRPDYDESFIQKINTHGARILFVPMSRTINPLIDIPAFFKIYQNIKKNRYDIVHAHSSKAGALFRLAAWINKVPLIMYTPHCFYFQCKRGISRRIFVLLERLLGLFCHLIIVSEHEKKIALIHHVVPKKKLVNINNAINFNEYKQYKNIHKIKDEWNIPVEHFIIGGVGRLSSQKDWHTFIKTAKLVLQKEDKVTFIVAGDGPLKEELCQMVSNLALSSNIRLLGHVQDISKMFSILDLFISTSLWEGLPYTFLEAGYFKKPVIATGTYDPIPMEKYFGFVSTPVEEHEIIANEILKIIRDNSKRDLLGKKTFELVTQKYSFKEFVDQHQLLYSKDKTK